MNLINSIDNAGEKELHQSTEIRSQMNSKSQIIVFQVNATPNTKEMKYETMALHQLSFCACTLQFTQEMLNIE